MMMDGEGIGILKAIGMDFTCIESVYLTIN